MFMWLTIQKRKNSNGSQTLVRKSNFSQLLKTTKSISKTAFLSSLLRLVLQIGFSSDASYLFIFQINVCGPELWHTVVIPPEVHLLYKSMATTNLNHLALQKTNKNFSTQKMSCIHQLLLLYITFYICLCTLYTCR